jgi:UDP-GlcNAc:undecaprenyl-phosphate/decaprenyl-phosphate GlcNAc-1-phosphate transferase
MVLAWSLLGIPFVLTALVATVLGLLVRSWYVKHKWVDDPAHASHAKVVHEYPVPRGGGLVVWGGLFIVSLALLPLDKHLAGILLGATVLALVGVWDDIKDIHPGYRLVAGLIAALLVVGAGIGIAYITNPWGGVIHLNQPQIPLWLFGKMRTIWVLADLFALLWIVWCMNMLNWSKGVDGQLPGIVVIAALIVGILSMRFVGDSTQWPVIVLSGITAGAFFGLLVWNVYPQRMMPGYGGGSLAGYLLAVLSILSGAKLATLLLVLGVPMIDAVYVVYTRIRSGKSPIWGDRNHLHHALMDLGWGKRRIAAFYWLMTLLLGLVALQLNPEHKAFTIVLISLVIGGVGVWIRRSIISSKVPDRDSG